MSVEPSELAGLSDPLLAGELVRRAGRLLQRVRADNAGLAADDPKALGRMGDRESNELILGLLASARPQDAVLSEESKDAPERLSASRVWIIDPVDGTREYGESRADWAVHAALWQDGRLVAGAVAQPDLAAVFTSDPPPDLAPAGEGPVRLVVSRTRPPVWAQAVAADLGGVLVPMGSAGAKVMSVVRGVSDVYVHAGGQYEWDSAAPVAVARAAGLHVSRVDGSEPAYNQADPYLPDIVVCRPELAARVLAATQQVLSDSQP